MPSRHRCCGRWGLTAANEACRRLSILFAPFVILVNPYKPGSLLASYFDKGQKKGDFFEQSCLATDAGTPT